MVVLLGNASFQEQDYLPDDSGSRRVAKARGGAFSVPAIPVRVGQRMEVWIPKLRSREIGRRQPKRGHGSAAGEVRDRVSRVA